MSFSDFLNAFSAGLANSGATGGLAAGARGYTEARKNVGLREATKLANQGDWTSAVDTLNNYDPDSAFQLASALKQADDKYNKGDAFGIGNAKGEFLQIQALLQDPNVPEDTKRRLMRRSDVLEKSPDIAYLNAIGTSKGNVVGKYEGGQWEKGQKGWVDVDGQSKALKGSEAEQDWLKENSKELENNAVIMRGASTVPVDIDRSLDLIKKNPEAAQFTGAMMSSIPGTPAFDLKELIGSVQSQIGIDTLLNIKRSGAGLGQVPQSQLEMLSSILGNLNQAQSIPQLEYNLKRVKTLYNDILSKAQESNDRIMSKIYDPNQKTESRKSKFKIVEVK